MQRIESLVGSSRKMITSLKRISLLVFVLLFSLQLVACRRSSQELSPKDYGDYGAQIARRIADLGARPSGSDAERQAADLILDELHQQGWNTEEQQVNLPSGGSSRNIIVRVPGSGFYQRLNGPAQAYVAQKEGRDSEQDSSRLSRTLVFLARINTEYGEGGAEAATGMDGISDNASGVASLLTAMKEIKKHIYGFDLVFAFVTGGDQDYAGTRVLASSFDEAALNRIDGVIEVRNIYAGAKVYAHAGWNQLTGDRYVMRRKAYEMTDVSIAYGLIDEVGEDLYLNEFSSTVPSPLDGRPVVYREFTLHPSDYRVFDALNVPIVFVEAFDYNAKTVEEMVENRSQSFSETSGQVAGTRFDRRSILENALDPDRLETRVNFVAFLLVGMADRGATDANDRITVSDR